MLGPQGTGGLYVREGVKVEPLITGGSGIDTYNVRHPDSMPTALEAGTLNGHGIAGLCAAVTYLEQTGKMCIRDRARSVRSELMISAPIGEVFDKIQVR